MNAHHHIDIYQGPRTKSLATRHLEYIAHALLSEPDTVTFIHFANPILVSVAGVTFNLTTILDAKPDFEQLVFSDNQLNNYLDVIRKFQPSFADKQFYRYASVQLSHPEKLAIYLWTTSKHEDYNLFLREATLKKEIAIADFLTVCIAASALSKPMQHPIEVKDSTRGEDLKQAIHHEREHHRNCHRTVTHHGFTASSYNHHYLYGNSLTLFRQEGSHLNPIGKHIEDIAMVPDEEEVLFPPNTEFAYIKTDHLNYECIPVRSINAEVFGENATYKHSFNRTALKNIHRAAHRLAIKTPIQNLQPSPPYSYLNLFSAAAAVTTTTLVTCLALSFR